MSAKGCVDMISYQLVNVKCFIYLDGSKSPPIKHVNQGLEQTNAITKVSENDS